MKKIIFALLFAACFASVSFAQTDQITLTTYYPAPFGMYQEMRVMGKLGVGITNPTEAVEIVGGTIATPEVLLLKNSSGGQALLKIDSPTKAATTNIGITFDVHSGTPGSIEYNDAYGFGIMGGGSGGGPDGNVGVGTTTPFTDFHVKNKNVSYADPLPLVFFGAENNQPALAAVSYFGHTFSTGDAKFPVDSVGIYVGGHDGTKTNLDGYAGYFAFGKNYFADNVGVGVTDPTAKLHATASSGYTAHFTGSGTASNNYALRLDNGGSAKAMNANYGGLYIYSPDAASYGVHQVGANSYNYFGGKVGIGSSIPICDLYVKNTDFSYAATIENSPGTNGPTIQVFNDMSPASYNIKTGILLAGASDSMGVYQTGGSANYFGGKVGIETTNINTGSEVSLFTDGGINIWQSKPVLAYTTVSGTTTCATGCGPNAICLMGITYSAGGGSSAAQTYGCSNNTNAYKLCFCY